MTYWWQMVSYLRRPERRRKATRRRVRKGDCCHWCGRQLVSSWCYSSLALTKDHVTPQSMGGKRTVLCCRACNQLKGSMSRGEWSSFMERNPKWWRLWQGGRRS